MASSRDAAALIAAATLGIAACFCGATPAQAVETPTTLAPTAHDGEFSLEPTYDRDNKDRRIIETMLTDMETKWNAHELDAVMLYYADNYVNNDGLDKKAVRELTREFWSTYPDAKTTSRTKQIRVEGRFATVETRDLAVGNTAKPMPGLQSRGELTSISEGQYYLKRIGKDWKIIGDRINYEKVRLAFGLAQKLETSFTAPEQVKSGQEYSAKLKVKLPADLVAMGSIVSEPLKYPQPPHKDVWRAMEDNGLERLIHANTSNYNELLMATIGITDGNRRALKGFSYLTRRLNVVPATTGDDSNGKIAKDAKGKAKAEKEEDKSKAPATESNSGSNSDADSDSDSDSEQSPGDTDE